MKIEALSSEEQLALCRDVERVCGFRLRSLRRYADERDLPLQKLLDERIADGRIQARALERGTPVSLPEKDVDRFIRDRFPSQRLGFGEGPLTRDVALYLAECVEDERCRFYHEMARAASDDATRALFERMAARDAESLKFLRTVVI